MLILWQEFLLHVCEKVQSNGAQKRKTLNESTIYASFMKNYNIIQVAAVAATKTAQLKTLQRQT